MANLTHTVSGDMASFKTAARVPIESLKVHFTPTQLGTGDPSPSNVREIVACEGVTGYQTGKNWYNQNAYSTYDDFPNEGAYAYIYTDIIQLLPNTQYKTSVFYKDESISCEIDNVYLQVYSGYETAVGSPAASPKYFIFSSNIATDNKSIFTTGPTGKLRVGIHKASGSDTTKWPSAIKSMMDKYNFQIELGSTATSYEPYQGTTIPVTFADVCKNQWNADVNEYFSFPINSGDTYTISGDVTGDGYAVIRWYDEDKTFIASILISGTGNDTRKYVTFTPDQDVLYLKVEVSNATITNIQLEQGSTATTYEPHISNVYGGYVDVATGEIVQEWDEYIFTGDENIQVGTWYSGGQFFINQYITDSTTGHIPRFYSTTEDNIFCNILKPVTSGYYNVKEGMISVLGNDYNPAWRYIVWGADGFGETAEECKAKLKELYDNGTPLTVVSKLASPYVTTYHISPTAIRTLLGANNFWSNTGETVDVSYAVHNSAPMILAKKKIMNASPHIESASGDIANFSTDLIAPIKSCKVGFLPKQEGTGDPSPSNVRSIGGWTGCEVNVSGKNLIPSNPQIASKQLKPVNGSTFETSSYYVIYFSVPKGSLRITSDNKAMTYMCLCDEIPDVGVPYYNAVVMTNRISYTIDNSDGHRYICMLSTKYLTVIEFLEIVSTNHIRLVLGTTDGEYGEPVERDDLNASFPSTIYGGYVDLVNGEVVEEWEYGDMGDLNWDSASAAGSTYVKGTTWPIAYGNTDIPLLFCDNAKVITLPSFNKSIGVSGYFATVNSSGRFYYMSPDINGYTSNQIKAYFQGKKYAIKLSTPILVTTLSPQQLKTLKGTNNIWSDTNGTIELKYYTH